MVGHEAIGVTDPVAILDNFSKNREKTLSIRIIPKNMLPGIASRGDMVKGTGEFYTERACHKGTL